MGRAYRVVGAQAVTIIFGSAVLFFLLGTPAATATFLGGMIAVANSLFLIWSMRASAQRTVQSAQQELAKLVRFSMERFLMVALLMVAGLGWLKLMPASLLLGFVLGQLTLVVSTIFSGIEK